MGGLPENWVQTTIGEVYNFIGGGTPSKAISKYWNGNIPWASIKDISQVKVLESTQDHISDEGLHNSAANIAECGDLILGTRMLPGKTVLTKVRTAINQDLKIVKPKTEIASKFTMYQFDFLKDEFIARSGGTTVQGITIDKINEISFLLPPVPEQKSIVAKLDNLFAHLDQLKARLENIPTLLKQFRQAALEKAYKGDLTAEWSSKNKTTPVRSKIESIKPPQKPSRYKSKNTSIIPGQFALSVGKPDLSIPQRYLWIELVEIAKLETGHTPSRKHPEYWKDGDVCWIGIRDASDNHSKTIFDTYQKTNDLGLANSASRLLPTDTVCLSRTASVGYVVKMGKPMATSQDFVNWVCTDAIDPDWLKWLLVAENESIWKFGKGTTHKTVYFPEVISFNVALAPIEEQKEIVRRLELLFAIADRIETNYQTLKEKIDRLPQAILTKAFRGELIGNGIETLSAAAEVDSLYGVAKGS